MAIHRNSLENTRMKARQSTAGVQFGSAVFHREVCDASGSVPIDSKDPAHTRFLVADDEDAHSQAHPGNRFSCLPSQSSNRPRPTFMEIVQATPNTVIKIFPRRCGMSVAFLLQLQALRNFRAI